MTLANITADAIVLAVKEATTKTQFLPAMVSAVGGVSVPNNIVEEVGTKLVGAGVNANQVGKIKSVLRASEGLPTIHALAKARFENAENLKGNVYTASFAAIKVWNGNEETPGNHDQTALQNAIDLASPVQDAKVLAKRELISLLDRATKRATDAGYPDARAAIESIMNQI